MCRKSCLDCVFCLRHKDYLISFLYYPNNSHWRNEEYNLTKKEALELQNGSANFLFEDKRNYDKWIEEYEKKENEVNQKELERWEAGTLQSNRILEMNINSSLTQCSKLDNILGKKYDRYKEFGMEEMPETPVHDYLSCWKEQWNADCNTEILKTLKTLRCKFFYPLNEKGEKTLLACNEEVLYKLDNKKFWKGIVYGAVATLCVSFVLFICEEFIL